MTTGTSETGFAETLNAGTDADGGVSDQLDPCTGEPITDSPDPTEATFDAPCEKFDGSGVQDDVPDDIVKIAQDLEASLSADAPSIPTDPSSALNPNSGAGGSTITISGINFGGGVPEVLFGSKAATNVQVINPTSITVVPPPADAQTILGTPVDVTINYTATSSETAQRDGVASSALTQTISVVLPGAWTYTSRGDSVDSSSSQTPKLHSCASAIGPSSSPALLWIALLALFLIRRRSHAR
jgi:MYXO-CTERM domain-containing protein